MFSYTWIDISLAVVAIYLVKQISASWHPAPFPPGPKPLPLIGNMLDIPSIGSWLTFSEWATKFGDIIHVRVPGKHIIVLNSPRLAIDMLDRKGSKYSDRPSVPMAGELVGGKLMSVFLPYGHRFRESRKLFQRAMGTRVAVEAYNSIEKVETRKFLQRVCENPEELSAHIRTTAGAIILRVSYGYEVKDDHDPLVDLAEKALVAIAVGSSPSFLVNIIPLLKYVPSWLPGAEFKSQAREWSFIMQDMVNKPYQFVKEQLASGTAPKSFTSNSLDGRVLTDEYESLVKWVGASMYAGGAGPTISSANAFFLAMTLFPEVQKKAQVEIDSVVGSDRLPAFSDRKSLPYVDALVKEVFRWHVVVPLGFVHRTTEDDIHDGYYIPKGSWVFPNAWFMLRDPRTYANPSMFDPKRFLPRNGIRPERDPRTICFGFGRRICPGLHLADASLWLMAAMTLAVFDISKFIENGVKKVPEVEPTLEMLSHPKPFKCNIKPRSVKALELIQQEVQD
ncbi:cytochrome P450 [Scleroderma yunnanense]